MAFLHAGQFIMVANSSCLFVDI